MNNHNSKSSNKLSSIDYTYNNLNNNNSIQEVINKKNKENLNYMKYLINQNKKNSHSQFNPSSNFLDGKINKEIPIVIPFLFTFSKKFNSNSECKRYEKNTIHRINAGGHLHPTVVQERFYASQSRFWQQ